MKYVEINFANPVIKLLDLSKSYEDPTFKIVKHGWLQIRGDKVGVTCHIQGEGLVKCDFDPASKVRVREVFSSHGLNYREYKFRPPMPTLMAISNLKKSHGDLIQSSLKDRFFEFIRNNVIFNTVRDIKQYSEDVLEPTRVIWFKLYVAGYELQELSELVDNQFIESKWCNPETQACDKEIKVEVFVNGVTEKNNYIGTLLTNMESPSEFTYNNINYTQGHEVMSRIVEDVLEKIKGD